PTRAADALMLAVSFAQASKSFATEIHVLSDGVVDEELPPAPYPITFVRLGKSDANQGISSVNVSRAPGEPAQAFVRVENASKDGVERTVTLRNKGQVVDAKAIALPPEGGAAAFFEIPEPEGDEAQVFTAT